MAWKKKKKNGPSDTAPWVGRAWDVKGRQEPLVGGYLKDKLYCRSDKYIAGENTKNDFRYNLTCELLTTDLWDAPTEDTKIPIVPRLSSSPSFREILKN